jgi:hypothetical protein
MYDGPEISIREVTERTLMVRAAPEAIGGWDVIYVEDGTLFAHYDLKDAPTEVAALNLAAIEAYEAMIDEVRHLNPASLKET